jgi:hypothetical protein
VSEWAELSAGKIQILLADSEGSGEFNIVWPNVFWVGQQFWDAQVDSGPTAQDIAWHHLVMSAGNFKRQAGRID